MNLAGILHRVGRRAPDAPAVSGLGLELTFGQLCERSQRLAGALRGPLQLAAADRVVVCVENTPEFFELVFACWTAGLCAVPVNAKLHPREVAQIARDAGARLAFTSSGLAAGLDGLCAEVEAVRELVVAGSARYAALLGADAIPAQPVAPDDIAWLFYTSGTTGRPKGAMLTHRNLLFMSHAYCADIDRVEAGETMLHAAPLSHGSGLYGLPHLFGGGHQVVLGRFEADAVFDALARRPKVSLFAAPTMVTRLVNSPAAAGADVSNLKTLCYGGGPMYGADLEQALALFGPRLYQLYGQGESPMTITGLDKRLHAGADAGADAAARAARLGSCGYARTGVDVRVVDTDDEPLPPGARGEIVTRSDCVMRGYWADSDASAAALKGGWLHTGDIGSMDEHGLLTLHDRSKDLIISGGSNIYPREIEEVLLLDPRVLECAVVGRPHADWGEEVVAFVVCRDEAQVGAETLDALVTARIARFKRPREYRFVARLPKNNYGKILKTELRSLLARAPE
ncbi:MAG: AMP-binding protein [Caldimonas sp.]